MSSKWIELHIFVFFIDKYYKDGDYNTGENHFFNRFTKSIHYVNQLNLWIIIYYINEAKNMKIEKYSSE
jgi:hypothetical protein